MEKERERVLLPAFAEEEGRRKIRVGISASSACNADVSEVIWGKERAY